MLEAIDYINGSRSGKSVLVCSFFVEMFENSRVEIVAASIASNGAREKIKGGLRCCVT